MSPPPRVNSTPTMPSDDGIRSKLKTFLDWKAAVFAFVLMGAAGARVWAGVATQTDVKREHDFASEIGRRVDANVRRLDIRDEGDRWRDETLKKIADRLGVYAPPPPTAPAP